MFSSSFSTANSQWMRISEVHIIYEASCLKNKKLKNFLDVFVSLESSLPWLWEVHLDEAHQTGWNEILAAEMCGTCPSNTKGGSASRAAANERSPLKPNK